MLTEELKKTFSALMGFGIILACFSWLVIFPTIGLLYLLGYLH